MAPLLIDYEGPWNTLSKILVKGSRMMTAHAATLSMLLLMLPAFAAADESGHRNHLGDETSPYLLQHATNPVWWYPWGDDAFEAARRENKPIFLSVGYSTCYWCHFMERDSFEKDDVAALLNEHFISIKVDREERPDVDNIYMTALRTISGGGGGWPMSLFLTPDGKPFFGRSTITHDQFIDLLQRIASDWRADPDRLVQHGSTIARELGQRLNPQVAAGTTNDAIFGAFYLVAIRRYDNAHGGFGNSRKFPRPHVLLALLRYYRRSDENHALEMVTETLAAMAHGGTNDILAGGFHRYSTDKRFDIPHFEKMLYDNAGLAIAALEAFQASGDPEMAFVARMTLDWTLAEMTHKEGGFFSAQDAGEFDAEGEYYAWTFGEIESLLTPEQLRYVKPVLRISKAGNFEGKNVFHLARGRTLSDEMNNPLFSGACAALLAARNERKRPHLDDKILTSWNGLMIAAMARGYQVLGDKRYLDGARHAADFISNNMVRQDGTLYRAWREGKASQRAVVNDYAFLIHGLIELYQADFDTRWFEWALSLQQKQDVSFWDSANGGYYFDDAADKTLLARSKKYEDMALASGNSIAALNLLQLADLTYSEELRERATQTIKSASGFMRNSSFNYTQMLVAIDYANDRSKEIAIIGGDEDRRTRELLAPLRSAFLPNKVVALGGNVSPPESLKLLSMKVAIDGVPTVYVCERGSCKLPTTRPQELLSQLSTYTPLR